MPDQPVVQIRELTKRYGSFTALDSLSIDLDRGRILGFIGPNGAGKTTTIKILVGLARPTSGSASIAGHDCTRETSLIKRLVGYMPDTFGSYDNMRVREYLDFFGAAYKIPRRDRLRRVEEVCDLVGASHMLDLYCEGLSHGMKQRVGICRTMLHDPQVLILDEPANGLDPQARIEMRELLLKLAAMGKTLMVTSHILPELARICDQVAIITQGKLRAFGTLDQIMRLVNQRRIFEATVLDPADVRKLAALVQQMLGEQASVTASPQVGEVRFETSADDTKIAALLAAAVGRGIGVVELHELMLDLEDAFLEVTGMRRREGGDVNSSTAASGNATSSTTTASAAPADRAEETRA